MRIAIMEKTNFSQRQVEKLQKLGEVKFYDGLTQEQANEIAPHFDVVVCNWLDPTTFILNMKKGSLVALLSTGYGWITNLNEARKKGVLVANIPGYSTEAVAEHLLGLLLGVSKNIFSTVNKADNKVVGFELSGKTVGVIGLGNIGSRFANIMQFFGAQIITYNRAPKKNINIEDVSLDTLLQRSDIICVTCSVNNDSKNLINATNIKKIKKGAIIIGSTWGIIDESALNNALENGIVSYVAFDAAIESKDQVAISLLNNAHVFLTPHIAYNTFESEVRQLDICVNNITSFRNGKPLNIVN